MQRLMICMQQQGRLLTTKDCISAEVSLILAVLENVSVTTWTLNSDEKSRIL